MSEPKIRVAPTPMRTRILRAAHSLKELHRRARKIETDIEWQQVKLDALDGTEPTMEQLDPISAELGVLWQDERDTNEAIKLQTAHLHKLIEEWSLG